MSSPTIPLAPPENTRFLALSREELITIAEEECKITIKNNALSIVAYANMLRTQSNIMETIGTRAGAGYIIPADYKNLMSIPEKVKSGTIWQEAHNAVQNNRSATDKLKKQRQLIDELFDAKLEKE